MSYKYGLDEHTIQKIIDILKKHPDIIHVLLYGSRAINTHHQGSDIDLCIKDSVSQDILFQVRNDFEESSLPYKFDIDIYNQIDNENLRDHIQRVGKIFYTQQAEK